MTDEAIRRFECAASTELLRLATRAGDPTMILDAYALRRFGLIELGDMRAVAGQLKAHSRLAEELRQPFNCELVKSDVFQPVCGCYRAATLRCR
jgi:hypothetical protein